MTTPDATMTNRGATHQTPMVLCQFQSRALPRRPWRNQTAGRRHLAAPILRQPQVEAAQQQTQKEQVAGACDAARRGARFQAHGQPSMPVLDFAEEAADRRGAFAENFAGEGMQIQDGVAAELGGNRLGGIGAQGECGGQTAWRTSTTFASRISGATRRPVHWRRRCRNPGRRSERSVAARPASTPVTDMMKMTIPASDPAARCSQKKILRIIQASAHCRSRL